MNLLFSPQTVHSKKLEILNKFKQIYGDLEIKKETDQLILNLASRSKGKIELTNSEKGHSD